MSDPSALLLLKYEIHCHKSSLKLHLWSNLGHKLVPGAGGSAHARSAQTINAYVLSVLLLMLNLQFNSSFESLSVMYPNITL